MKSKLVIFFLLLGVFTNAQSEINNYKYIIVPKKFDEFKKENQYRTNGLTKFLFDKNGFNVVFDDQLPQDLNANRCLGLKVKFINKSSFLTVKTAFEFIDCNNKVVYTTKLGISKEKEYERSFNETIRESFQSFDGFTHNYTGATTQETVSKEEPIVVSFKNDVKKLPTSGKTEEKIISFKNDKEKAIAISLPENGKSAVEQVLYAQQLPNGFQLVDNTPKILYKLYKTSVSNVFMANYLGKNGMVFLKDGNWFFEHYEGTQLSTKKLNIKF